DEQRNELALLPSKLHSSFEQRMSALVFIPLKVGPTSVVVQRAQPALRTLVGARLGKFDGPQVPFEGGIWVTRSRNRHHVSRIHGKPVVAELSGESPCFGEETCRRVGTFGAIQSTPSLEQVTQVWTRSLAG